MISIMHEFEEELELREEHVQKIVSYVGDCFPINPVSHVNNSFIEN
jgi:hypothetical protein